VAGQLTEAPRRVVVTADDFGLHPDINEGVVRAHRDGVVRCASLVAGGDAFEEAVDALRGLPSLQAAVHLTLVEERPVLPPSRVPSLVGADGRFVYDHRRFVGRWLAGRVRTGEVERELRAQVERVLAAGVRPVHLNAHQHLHLLPGVWKVALALAEEYGIPRLRHSRFQTVFERSSPAAAPFRAGLNVLSARGRRVAARRPRAPRLVPTVGLHAAGRLDAAALRGILRALPDGVHELVTHPGRTTPALRARYRWDYRWTEETEALCGIAPAELAALGVSVEAFAA